MCAGSRARAADLGFRKRWKRSSFYVKTRSSSRVGDVHARRSQTRAGFYIYSTPARRRACWCGCARANRRRKKLSSLSYWRLWAPQTVKVVRRASVDARLRARARRSVGWLAGCGTRACRGRGRKSARWGFFARVSGFVSVREGRKATSEELAVVRGAATARSRALGRSRPRFFSPARTRDPHGAPRLSTLPRVLSPWAFRSLPVIPA